MLGGERLDRASRGLQARRQVGRVLLASGVNIVFWVDIPEALAPAVLRDAACDIARRACPSFPPQGHPQR